MFKLILLIHSILEPTCSLLVILSFQNLIRLRRRWERQAKLCWWLSRTSRWQHFAVVIRSLCQPNLNLELLFSHLLCWAKKVWLHEKSYPSERGGWRKAEKRFPAARSERWQKIKNKKATTCQQPLSSSLKLQNSCFFLNIFDSLHLPLHSSRRTCASNCQNCLVMWF